MIWAGTKSKSAAPIVVSGEWWSSESHIQVSEPLIGSTLSLDPQNLTIHPPACSTAAAGACYPWLFVHGFHPLLLAIFQLHLCPQQGWYSRPVYLSTCSHANVTLNANDAIRLHFAGRLRRSFVVAFCSLLYPLHANVRWCLSSWVNEISVENSN